MGDAFRHICLYRLYFIADILLYTVFIYFRESEAINKLYTYMRAENSPGGGLRDNFVSQGERASRPFSEFYLL